MDVWLLRVPFSKVIKGKPKRQQLLGRHTVSFAQLGVMVGTDLKHEADLYKL